MAIQFTRITRLAGQLLLAVACLGLTDMAAQAQDLASGYQQNYYDSRLQELERQIAELRAGQPQVVVMDDQTDHSGLAVGYSFLFAKVHMKESFEATVLNDAGTPLTSADDTLRLAGLDNDYEISPRIWLGYEGENGLGIRASYWQFDHNTDPSSLVSSGATAVGGTGTQIPGAAVTTVIFPATITAVFPGDVLTFQNGLELHSVDLEGTLQRQFFKTDILIGAGLRYASVEQTFNSTVSNAAGFPLASLNWSREFQGIGPTMSVDARHPLWWNGVSALGRFRGSLLYGEKTLERRASAVGAPWLTLPAGAPATVILSDGEDFSGAFEMALGAEYRRDLGAWGELFVQGTYEGQLWTEAGEPTLTFLGFHGFGLSLGIQR